MTKFELPEKPKKTNTSEDFNNLRKAVDELDKFDYAWKTHANKADRRINAANKYIEELERENQRLIAENVAVKTLVDNAKLQQALPVVPEFVAEFIESYKDRRTIYGVFDKISKNLKTYPKLYEWVFEDENSQATFALAFITGKYQVEKPQLFRLKLKNAPISNYYLWLNQATGKVFVDKKFLDWTNHDNVKNIFTKQEIAKISDGAFVNNEAFELMPVEDGE